MDQWEQAREVSGVSREDLQEAREIARRLSGKLRRRVGVWVDADVLENEAELGVYRALMRWDDEKRGEMSFLRWAACLAWQMMCEELRRQSVWTRDQRDLIARLREEGEELEGWMRPAMSFESVRRGMVGDSEERWMGFDFGCEDELLIAVVERVSFENLKRRVRRLVIDDLNEMEREIVLRYFWLDESGGVIAKKIERCTSRVAQVRRAALERLRIGLKGVETAGTIAAR